uniref:Uncharacterized protein n=1 Tax=Arundo donax TaxID=35708 RepID=A0A0A9FMU3_ARUDO
MYHNKVTSIHANDSIQPPLNFYRSSKQGKHIPLENKAMTPTHHSQVARNR